MPGKQKDPVHDHFVDVVVRETVTDDKGVETVINKTKSIEVPALWLAALRVQQYRAPESAPCGAENGPWQLVSPPPQEASSVMSSSIPGPTVPR